MTDQEELAKVTERAKKIEENLILFGLFLKLYGSRELYKIKSPDGKIVTPEEFDEKVDNVSAYFDRQDRIIDDCIYKLRETLIEYKNFKEQEW